MLLELSKHLWQLLFERYAFILVVQRLEYLVVVIRFNLLSFLGSLDGCTPLLYGLVSDQRAVSAELQFAE